MEMVEKLEGLEELFENHDVRLAYLFGSYLDGSFDERSDVDVGVLFEDYRGLVQVSRLETELQGHFDVEVDVRPLNVDDIVFKKEVVETGVPVFESGDRIGFETRVFQRYMDMKPYIDRFREKRSKRLEVLKT